MSETRTTQQETEAFLELMKTPKGPRYCQLCLLLPGKSGDWKPEQIHKLMISIEGIADALCVDPEDLLNKIAELKHLSIKEPQ